METIFHEAKRGERKDKGSRNPEGSSGSRGTGARSRAQQGYVLGGGQGRRWQVETHLGTARGGSTLARRRAVQIHEIRCFSSGMGFLQGGRFQLFWFSSWN